jgi:hypothetical protein
MTPLWLALAPWGVGPSPSAHAVDDGVVVSARADAFHTGMVGARVGIQGTGDDRLTVAIDAVSGAGWALCPDCGSRGVGATARLNVVRHEAFRAAVWSHGTLTTGSPEALAGVAVEGGSERLRVDASTPLAATTFVLTTLRVGPEVGLTARWSSAQRTRLAVVGLEPGVALQHRWRVAEALELEPTVRFGEEGLGLGLAVRGAL